MATPDPTTFAFLFNSLQSRYNSHKFAVYSAADCLGVEHEFDRVLIGFEYDDVVIVDPRCADPRLPDRAHSTNYGLSLADIAAIAAVNFGASESPNKYPYLCPPRILREIANLEAERLNVESVDRLAALRESCVSYFECYGTRTPGYDGPLVVVAWADSPSVVSSFVLRNGSWRHV